MNNMHLNTFKYELYGKPAAGMVMDFLLDYLKNKDTRSHWFLSASGLCVNLLRWNTGDLMGAETLMHRMLNHSAIRNKGMRSNRSGGYPFGYEAYIKCATAMDFFSDQNRMDWIDQAITNLKQYLESDNG